MEVEMLQELYHLQQMMMMLSTGNTAPRDILYAMTFWGVGMATIMLPDGYGKAHQTSLVASCVMLPDGYAN